MIRKLLQVTAMSVFALWSAAPAQADCAGPTGGESKPCGGADGILKLLLNDNGPPTAKKLLPVCDQVVKYDRYEHVAQLQTALNDFGFDAGVADGHFGRKTGAALDAYQIYVGQDPTGRPRCRDVRALTEAQDYVAGLGDIATQIATANPDGVKGLLHYHIVAQAVANLFDPDRISDAINVPVQITHVCGSAARVADFGTAAIGAHWDAPGAGILQAFCAQTAANWAVFKPDAHDRRIALVSQSPQNAADLGFARCSVQVFMHDIAWQTPDQIRDQARRYLDTVSFDAADKAQILRDCIQLGYTEHGLHLALHNGLLLETLEPGTFSEMLGHHLALRLASPASYHRAADWYQQAMAGSKAHGDATLSDFAAYLRTLPGLSDQDRAKTAPKQVLR